jgi:hypothetical protein
MSDQFTADIYLSRILPLFFWLLIILSLLFPLFDYISWSTAHYWITAWLLFIILVQRFRMEAIEDELIKIRNREVEQERHLLERLIAAEKRINAVEQQLNP